MISLSVKAENERMRWGLYGAGDGFYIKNVKKWPRRGKQDSWQGLAGPALPCPALPCPALPCPALLSPAKPCQLSCFPLRVFFFFFGVSKPRHEPKQGTQTRERTARAHSQPHAHMKTGHDGSVRALSQNPWMTPDQSDRTLTLPPLPLLRRNTKNMTAQEHDYIRLTHNRQDKKNQNTETKRGGRKGRQASASRTAQKVTPGRGGRVEPGRLRQSRSPSRWPRWGRRVKPGRLRPNKNPGGWPGWGRQSKELALGQSLQGKALEWSRQAKELELGWSRQGKELRRRRQGKELGWRLVRQGAWTALGLPPGRQWAPEWPPGLVEWRKPSSAYDKSGAAA